MLAMEGLERPDNAIISVRVEKGWDHNAVCGVSFSHSEVSLPTSPKKKT
jgi:hypothetical protein